MSTTLQEAIDSLHQTEEITDEAYEAAIAFAPIAVYFWPDCTLLIHGKDSVVFNRSSDGKEQYVTVSKHWISFLDADEHGITLRSDNRISIRSSHDDSLRKLALDVCYATIKTHDHTQWFKSLAALCTHFGDANEIVKLVESDHT